MTIRFTTTQPNRDTGPGNDLLDALQRAVDRARADRATPVAFPTADVQPRGRHIAGPPTVMERLTAAMTPPAGKRVAQ